MKFSGDWQIPNKGENSRNCFTANNYVCEKMKEGEVRPLPPKDPVPDVPCPDGWDGWKGSANCYKWDFDEQVSWEVAEAHCQGG